MRQTFVMRNGKLVDKRFAEPLQPKGSAAFMAMRDISERVSPVDGSVITSRPQLIEHNRRNGCTDCGNEHLVKPGEQRQPKYMPPVSDSIREALRKHGH